MKHKTGGKRSSLTAVLLFACLCGLALSGCLRPAGAATPTPQLVLPTLASTALSTAPREAASEPGPTPSADFTQTSTASPTAPATDTPFPTNTPEPLTPTPRSTPTDAAFSCPNSPKMRLQVGDSARVTYTDGRPLRVRSDPEIDPDNILVQLVEGFRFEIVGGPVCVPIPDTGMNFVFWEIRAQSPRVTGWVAEGDSVDYYVEKWP